MLEVKWQFPKHVRTEQKDWFVFGKGQQGLCTSEEIQIPWAWQRFVVDSWGEPIENYCRWVKLESNCQNFRYNSDWFHQTFKVPNKIVDERISWVIIISG